MDAELWLELAADEGLAPVVKCNALKSEYGKLGMMIFILWKEWRKL